MKSILNIFYLGKHTQRLVFRYPFSFVLSPGILTLFLPDGSSCHYSCEFFYFNCYEVN